MSFVERYARAHARERRNALPFHTRLGRTMRIGDATAFVVVAYLAQGWDPRFETIWQPAPPERFTQAEIHLFLAFRLRAIVDIRAQLGLALEP